MTIRNGYEGFLYRDTAVSGGPTWTAVDTAGTVELPNTDTEADVTTRASGGFRMTSQVLTELGVEFTLFDDPTDEHLAALLAKKAAKTPIRMLVMNGSKDLDGTEGWDALWTVTQAPKSQPIDGKQTVKFVLKPGPGMVPTPFAGATP